ncbi:MAG: ribosome-binding protein aMBF1 (putative translation factor) [Phenylobacterium sp.]|jgi:ribosome-binding protein aMBF1 (putative translation factor)
MTGRNVFSKLTENISPQRRVAIEAQKTQLREEMELYELRQAIGISQESLAQQLDVKQPAIAKMERRSDLRIQSLRKLIEAMGGSLEIKAHFPQGDVTLTNYSKI